MLVSYLRGPVVPLSHPNVDDFTDSQPEEHEEFVPNAQPAHIVCNFLPPTEVVAPTVSSGSNTATVDAPSIPSSGPQIEGGTSSTQTRKKTKVTSNV